MDDDHVESQRAEVRRICRGLPEVEIRDGQHWALSVRGKNFAYHLQDHHGDGRLALNCKAARGDNEALVSSDPERFFMPPYMAHHGWVGLYLDLGPVDWSEVRELLTDAYLLAAPKRLARELAGRLGG